MLHPGGLLIQAAARCIGRAERNRADGMNVDVGGDGKGGNAQDDAGNNCFHGEESLWAN